MKQILIDDSNRPYLEKGAITAEMLSALDEAIQPDDIIVHHFNLNYGMGNKNPCDYIGFYSRWELKNVAKKRVNAQEVCSLAPTNGYESKYIRVYCKDIEKYYKVQEILRAYLKSKNEKISLW